MWMRMWMRNEKNTIYAMMKHKYAFINNVDELKTVLGLLWSKTRNVSYCNTQRNAQQTDKRTTLWTSSTPSDIPNILRSAHSKNFMLWARTTHSTTHSTANSTTHSQRRRNGTLHCSVILETYAEYYIVAYIKWHSNMSLVYNECDGIEWNET